MPFYFDREERVILSADLRGVTIHDNKYLPFSKIGEAIDEAFKTSVELLLSILKSIVDDDEHGTTFEEFESQFLRPETAETFVLSRTHGLMCRQLDDILKDTDFGDALQNLRLKTHPGVGFKMLQALSSIHPSLPALLANLRLLLYLSSVGSIRPHELSQFHNCPESVTAPIFKVDPTSGMFVYGCMNSKWRNEAFGSGTAN